MKYLARCVPKNFEALAALCHRDPGFPQTEADWASLIARADQEATDEGQPLPDHLLIDESAFRTWCASVAIVPGLDALRAYAIVQRAKKDSAAVIARLTSPISQEYND